MRIAGIRTHPLVANSAMISPPQQRIYNIGEPPLKQKKSCTFGRRGNRGDVRDGDRVQHHHANWSNRPTFPYYVLLGQLF